MKPKSSSVSKKEMLSNRNTWKLIYSLFSASYQIFIKVQYLRIKKI